MFNHKLLENNRDVYYSSRTGILFNLEGSRQVFAAGQNVPQTSLFLPKKNTVPLERLLLHREKRNQVPVDPSDPHSVLVGRAEEGSDSRALQEDDVELELELELETEVEVGDDGRNLSREIQLAPNAHDPWNVHASIPASPRNSGTMG